MNLDSLYDDEIIKLLPHKLQVKFAYECCLEVKDQIKDPRSLKALEVVGRWLRDEATEEELKKAREDVATAALNADYSMLGVTYTVMIVANAACYPSVSTANVSLVVFRVSDYLYKDGYTSRDRLVKFINSLSDIEKVLYFSQL